MKGNVIGFDPDTNTGAVSGYDGKRYDFTMQDWHGQSRPRRGDVVDFTPDDQHAAQIYLLEPEYIPPGFGRFYFSLAGRISRSQYWLRFLVPVFVVALVLNGVVAVGGERLNLLLTFFQLVILWPGIAVLVKRIHDRNKTGALVWALYGPVILAILFTIAAVAALAMDKDAAEPLGIISAALWIIGLIVGIWFFVEFGCMRGTIGGNRYGPDPVRTT